MTSKRQQYRGMTDAERLRRLMEAKGITAIELSRATGIPKGTISLLLSSKRTLSRQHIVVLARYFNVSECLGM